MNLCNVRGAPWSPKGRPRYCQWPLLYVLNVVLGFASGVLGSPQTLHEVVRSGKGVAFKLQYFRFWRSFQTLRHPSGFGNHYDGVGAGAGRLFNNSIP